MRMICKDERIDKVFDQKCGDSVWINKEHKHIHARQHAHPWTYWHDCKVEYLKYGLSGRWFWAYCICTFWCLVLLTLMYQRSKGFVRSDNNDVCEGEMSQKVSREYSEKDVLYQLLKNQSEQPQA